MWPPLKATFQDVGHPGGDGGRPWRGPRTTRRRRPTTHSRKQAGTVEPIDGGVVSDLTLAGPASDPGGAGERPWRGPAFWYSQKELGGRPWRGRRTTLAGRNSGTLRCGPHSKPHGKMWPPPKRYNLNLVKPGIEAGFCHVKF